jgi:putative hydrolase of the HAD superfamily
MLRAVLFDLWGTLIAFDPAVDEARGLLRVRMTRDALADLGYAYSGADIAAAFLAAGVEHERFHAEERDLSTRGRAVTYLRYLDPELGHRLDESGWAALDRAILTPALVHRPAAMPDAREALGAIRGLGLATGLISNTGITPGFVLRPILDDLGLLQLLDHTVFSDEVELAKPAAAIFGQTLAAMSLAPEETAFIGDQPRLDVMGARRAGLWSVQVGDLTEDGIEPHGRIAALGELVPALRALDLVG